MTKTILITGSTDGIGKLTATKLAAAGHHVLVHGRSQTKVEAAAKDIGAPVDMFVADLSDMSAIKTMAENIKEKYDTLDVLINNAGVLKTQNPILDNGHDIRFVVNTFAIAITIWTREMAKSLSQGPAIIAVNPGSMLASKMVKEGFGVDGNDLSVGADILIEAALGDRFADATGAYFDNDSGAFANPHAAAMDEGHAANVMDVITSFVSQNS
jgi:NADP-dependent 3-hydroxy acid dehydrogenase YdfG